LQVAARIKQGSFKFIPQRDHAWNFLYFSQGALRPFLGVSGGLPFRTNVTILFALFPWSPAAPIEGQLAAKTRCRPAQRESGHLCEEVL